MTTVNGYEIRPYANLRGANLRGANLYGANLYGANLSDANLYGANLRGADLHDADLHGANLHGANLSDANLSDADLSDADLRGADLSDADLSGADPHGANLENARLSAFALVPDSGAFTAWKKLSDGTVVKLLIPEDAARISTPTGRKCRASKALVLEGEGVSSHDPLFKYEAGATVEPREPFDDDWRVGCASGIHFFITRQEAEDYW